MWIEKLTLKTFILTEIESFCFRFFCHGSNFEEEEDDDGGSVCDDDDYDGGDDSDGDNGGDYDDDGCGDSGSGYDYHHDKLLLMVLLFIFSNFFYR